MHEPSPYKGGTAELPAALALIDATPQILPSGDRVAIRRARAVFRPWTAPITIDTWGHKPVLDVDGEQTFAEVAILRLFEQAGWTARWLEAYGSTNEWPLVLDRWHPAGIGSCARVPVGDESIAGLLRRILAANNGTCRGCWDVIAWRGSSLVFAESKRKTKDRINANQLRFLAAALRVGLPLEAFLIVEWVADGTARPAGERGAAPMAPPAVQARAPDSACIPSDSMAAVHRFDTSEEWADWRASNPDGYFLNENTKTIHRVGCRHYQLHGEDEAYLQPPKPCCEDLDELIRWATREHGGSQDLCSSCLRSQC